MKGKSKRKGKKGKSKKKFAKGKLTKLTNPRASMKLKSLVPQRYRTWLDCEIMGQISAGSFNAAGHATEVVKGNNPFAPYSAFAGYVIAANGVVSATTLQPAGLKNIMASLGGGLYQFYRVMASRIKVTVCPTVASDFLALVIVPEITAPAGSGSYGSTITGGQGPFSKGPIVCTGFNNVKQNTLHNYVTTAELFGVNSEAVLAEDDYTSSYNNSPANSWQWRILMQTLDAAINTNGVPLTVGIRYYVEFLTPSEAGLLDA